MSSTIEEYLITVARAVATRSSCRRKVGCVLADDRGRILATGYNGPPSGVKHCDERGCRNTCCSDGCEHSLIDGRCDAIHAEANALLQCADVGRVYYVAVTRAPCLPCTRLLLNSACSVVVYAEESSHTESEKYFGKARPHGIWRCIDG